METDTVQMAVLPSSAVTVYCTGFEKSWATFDKGEILARLEIVIEGIKPFGSVPSATSILTVLDIKSIIAGPVCSANSKLRISFSKLWVKGRISMACIKALLAEAKN